MDFATHLFFALLRYEGLLKEAIGRASQLTFAEQRLKGNTREFQITTITQTDNDV